MIPGTPVRLKSCPITAIQTTITIPNRGGINQFIGIQRLTQFTRTMRRLNQSEVTNQTERGQGDRTATTTTDTTVPTIQTQTPTASHRTTRRRWSGTTKDRHQPCKAKGRQLPFGRRQKWRWQRRSATSVAG